MARGFLSGVVWGGALGLGMMGAASLLVPLPVSPVVSDAAPGAAPAPARIEQASSGANSAQGGSQSDRTVVTGQVAPQTQVPDSDAVPALDVETLTPAGQPQTGAVAGLDAPQPSVETAAVEVEDEAPVLPNPLALAPMAPQPADDIAISTEPAAPPAPSVSDVEVGFDAPAQPQVLSSAEDAGAVRAPSSSAGTITAQAPQAPAAPDQVADTQNLADSTTPAAPAQTGALVIKPIDPPAALVTQTAQDDAEQTTEAAQAEDAEVPETQVVTAEDAQAEDTTTEGAQRAAAEAVIVQTEAEQTEVAQATQTETDQTETAQTETAQAETAQTETPQAAAQPDSQAQTGAASSAVVRRAIGTPSITLTDRNTGVTINRPTNVEAAPEAVTILTQAPDNSAEPPIRRYTQVFEHTGEKPLMSIVLIDDGTSEVAGSAGIAALRDFPYPLSFAVDASLKDAAERMAIYRAEGLEVLAMIDLPEGAQPTDAETTLGAILPRMSEVVGVLEGTRGGLQGSRPVADQVTAILAQTGHGLLTQDKGLNTMPKLARKAGVPADPVFRDFDSKGQSAQVIRRFLDQAAFKAGQEGAVVMLGRLRPDTVSALLLWGLQNRAGKVTLAPISTVLLRAE